MGFVKTNEEIARIQARLAEPRFLSAQLLTVQYLTRPEIVRHVLPPGLEPTEQPVATVMLGHWGRSNVCHAFSGTCFYVQARHKEHVGDYCYSSCQALARIKAEDFLPYAYSKNDDYAALDNEAEVGWGQVTGSKRGILLSLA